MNVKSKLGLIATIAAAVTGLAGLSVTRRGGSEHRPARRQTGARQRPTNCIIRT